MKKERKHAVIALNGLENLSRRQVAPSDSETVTNSSTNKSADKRRTVFSTAEIKVRQLSATALTPGSLV